MKKKNKEQPLKVLEDLLYDAEEIDVILPSENDLRELVKQAKDWNAELIKLKQSDNFPYLHTLEELLSKAHKIPVVLKEVEDLEKRVEAGSDWKDVTAHAFLRKKSRICLLEALSPRNGLFGGKKMTLENIKTFFMDIRSPAEIVAIYKEAEEKELEEMRNLRKANLVKNATDDKLCLCQKPKLGYMLQCELCKGLYHSELCDIIFSCY